MQLLQAAILFLEQFQNGRGGTALAGQEPDFHATETQVGGQSAPVIPSDTVGLQQHLQLLKEFWGQPVAQGWLGDRRGHCPGLFLRCLESEDFNVFGFQAILEGVHGDNDLIG